MGKRSTLILKAIANGDSDDWSGQAVKVDKDTRQITFGLLATKTCEWQAWGVMAGLDTAQAVALFVDAAGTPTPRVMAAGGVDAATVTGNFDRVYVSVENTDATSGDFTPQVNES